MDMGEYNEAVNNARRERDQGSVTIVGRPEPSMNDYPEKHKKAESDDRMRAIPGISDPKYKEPSEA